MKKFLILSVCLLLGFTGFSQNNMVTTSFGLTRDTVVNTGTYYLYGNVKGATLPPTAVFNMTKISGTVAPVITPVVSMDAITWAPAPLVASTDSVTWTGSNLTGTITRVHRFPVNFPYVGFKFVGAGTMSAYITGKVVSK